MNTPLSSYIEQNQRFAEANIHGHLHSLSTGDELGAATDLLTTGSRRMYVNAAYWCVGLEERITPDAAADLVGDYEPTQFGFGKWVKGRRASDHALAQ